MHPTTSCCIPEVTHPQGRHRLFLDVMRAMVRMTVEKLGKPVLAYATDKTHRMVTDENRHLIPPEGLAAWEAACDEFDAMAPADQDA